MTSGAGAASVSGKSTRKGHGGGGSASSVTAPTPSGTSTLKAKDTRKAAAAMARRDRARKAKLEAMASNLDALFKGSDIVVVSVALGLWPSALMPDNELPVTDVSKHERDEHQHLGAAAAEGEPHLDACAKAAPHCSSLNKHNTQAEAGAIHHRGQQVEREAAPKQRAKW